MRPDAKNDPLNFEARRTIRQQSQARPPLQNPNEARMKPPKKSHKNLLFYIFGIFGIVAGATCFIIPFVLPQAAPAKSVFPTIPSKTAESTAAYSPLTGEVLADASLAHSPVFCVQTPNGTDGARPQAGLNQAGVVFEAIAEAGITRFAAIYQNPTSSVIGPIRSLRLYYLQWDTPFDCAIVHAGGADDALAAVRSGGYKDLSEDYRYMYRGNYANYDRLWNNLFTNATHLKQSATDYGYTSDVKGFTRQTPDEAQKSRIDSQISEKLEITTPTDQNTSTLTPSVSHIELAFGNIPTYNLIYDYNAETNSYNRAYANGNNHDVYACSDENLGDITPENNCNLVTLSPSVVIAMVVQQSKSSDGYHEDITTIGSGTAYIFQNGTATQATWTKASASDQIKFSDESGSEISLIPGQTWISAIPTYGSVDY